MATRTFGGSAPSTTPQQPATTPAAAASRPASGPPSPPPGNGRGLDDPPPDVDTSREGGGGYEKRDRDYWDAHPLSAGDHRLTMYVGDMTFWGDDGATITWKCLDWDHGANRPREHHGRPIRWQQANSIAAMEARGVDPDKAKKAYAFWRRDLVSAYTAAGWPESSWPRAKDGKPVPPWHVFFVHRCPDGVVVPLVFEGTVRVAQNRERYPNLVSLVPLSPRTQAPLPWSVIPEVAALHGWRVAKDRVITVNAQGSRPGFNTTVSELDRTSVPEGHAGLRWYKAI